MEWQQADGCEIYLDISHGDHRGQRFQLARWGHGSAVFSGGGNLPNWESFQPGFDDAADLPDSRFLPESQILFGVETSTSPGGRNYEWWIDLGTVGSGTKMEPGLDFAFDVAVEDLDEDGSFTWMSWGPDTAKLESRGRLGDLLVGGAAGVSARRSPTWGT